MKLLSGKRIGQSGYELVLAVFFSFFLHAAVVAAALFLYVAVAPKVYVPPFYEVKLVGLPAEVAPLPQATPSLAAMATPKTEAPAPPKPTAKKAQPKAKKASRKAAKAAVKKGALPELEQKKSKVIQPEQPQQGPATSEQPSSPPAPGKSPVKTEGVAVSASSADSQQLAAYMPIMNGNIKRNWNPPPGAKGIQARVVFRVLRSGRVFGDVTIEKSSGNDYFDMAAKRAILSSSPFPPLPDNYYKQYAEFIVDLSEQE